MIRQSGRVMAEENSSVLLHLSPILGLSLDSFAAGVLAARLGPRFATLPFALACGLSDTAAAVLSRSIGAGQGLVLLLAAALCAALACRRFGHIAGWRTAASVTLPALFGLDSLACPVATADLPALTLASTSLAIVGMSISREAQRRKSWPSQATMLVLACLALFA